MNDVIEVENIVTMSCIRQIHLMSNLEIDPRLLISYGAPVGMQAKVTKEAGAFHLQAEWPYRGPLDMQAEGWKQVRRLIAWNLSGCLSVKVALHDASLEFQRLFGTQPRFGFISKMPKGVESGVEIGPLQLHEAEWCLRNCVLVGGNSLLD